MLATLYEKTKSSLATGCVVGAWAHTLDEADKKAFNDSLGNMDFSIPRLHRLYTEAGASFSKTSLNAHRNKVCACH